VVKGAISPSLMALPWPKLRTN